MAFLNIPKGKSEFEKIRREGLYYVDKTGLIGEILKSSGTQVTLITRPRRFGKTLGMSTLECFLDIQKDSKSLFEGLEISKQKDICDAWDNKGDIVIGNDVWIGYEAVIMSGVTIGDGAVIGTRAVVTKDVPPYTIVGGVPAGPIRRRFDDAEIEKLEALRWWDWDCEKIKRNIPVIQSGDIEALERAK